MEVKMSFNSSVDMHSPAFLQQLQVYKMKDSIQRWNRSQIFFQCTYRLQEEGKMKLFLPFCPMDLWLRTPSGKKAARNVMKLKAIVGKLIAQKRAETCNTKALFNGGKTMPLFDLMIHDSNNLNDSDICEEFSFFIGAATDTTSVALSFCFTLLGMHPDIQETLYEEVIEHVGSNEILNDHLPNLKYTEAVILESLRIVPPVPLLIRKARGDVDLGTKVIPKGTNIIIDIFHLQRDEKYWPNPLKFDPTRFFPENIHSNKTFTFLPFCGGPRDCLGKAQAMAMMKITVANVVRKYKVTSKYKRVDDIALESTVTLQSVGPLDCHFTLRTKE